MILTVAFWALLFLVEKRKVAESLMERNLYESDPIRHPYAVAVTLIFTVALMTCIFATLDNAVTLGHAGGSMDIGQWPRLILAVSGLVSGVLFDYGKGRYRNLIMYCVTLLSTVCILVIVSGGSFLLGLIVFYLSAGFFVVFFSTGFVRLAGKSSEQSLRHTHWKFFSSTDPVRRQYEDHDRIDRVICADQHCDLYLHGDGTDGCGIA